MLTKCLTPCEHVILPIEYRGSRGDRYLGMTAAMTQVPVPSMTTDLPLEYGEH